MQPQDFCYWLQGFLEMSDAKTLDVKQLQVLRDHLNLVFNKQTPNRSVQGTVTVDTDKVQKILNDVKTNVARRSEKIC